MRFLTMYLGNVRYCVDVRFEGDGMPRYRIPGYCKTTKRNRRTIYSAGSLDEAMQMAYNDQIIVDVQAIEELPEPPATENQIRFAKELGLQIPANITKIEMKRILDAALELEHFQKIAANLPPTSDQLKFAKELGIKNAANMTRRQLSQNIDAAIEYNDEHPQDNEQPRDEYGRYTEKDKCNQQDNNICSNKEIRKKSHISNNLFLRLLKRY